MSEQTTAKLRQYFTPVLLVMPPFSSEYDRLLTEAVAQDCPFDQSNSTMKSEWIELNKDGSNTTIVSLRELQQQLSFSSLHGKERVVILHHFDLVAPLAQNTLLKLLEEPPAQTRIFLTASRPEAVLTTITSRVTLRTQSDIQKDDFDTTKYKEIYSKITLGTQQDLIDLAGTFAEKQDALSVVTSLLRAQSATLIYDQSAPTLASIKQLLQTLRYLEANGNIKLVLENCFFHLKALTPAASDSTRAAVE